MFFVWPKAHLLALHHSGTIWTSFEVTGRSEDLKYELIIIIVDQTDQTNCGATINTFWCPVQIMMMTRKRHINAYGKWGKIKAQKRSCYPFSIQSKNEHCICMRTPKRKSVTITLHYQQPITTSIHLQFITWSTLFVLWICTWMDLENKCVPDLHSRGINKNQNQFADFGHFFF